MPEVITTELNMLEQVDLKPYNTFGLSAFARYFCSVTSVNDLQRALAFAKEIDLPVFILGGGSNILLREDFPGLVIRIALEGIVSHPQDDGSVIVTAASGENWHGFVEYCLHNGFYGLENLALIPGSVGAAPIQNIGAYGVEVKDSITELQLLDCDSMSIEVMTAEQCDFGYRDSIFKNELKGRKIVLSVSFRLHTTPDVNLVYGALAQALAQTTDSPRPQDVFDAVCQIRRSKLPDPKILGNAGSFFKNPVISVMQYEKVLQLFPTIPSFPVDQRTVQKKYNEAVDAVKIPAAWLIEQAGWKGKTLGGATVYHLQPLVLVNSGNASADEIVALAGQVMESVKAQFEIVLEPEVQWIPAK